MLRGVRGETLIQEKYYDAVSQKRDEFESEVHTLTASLKMNTGLLTQSKKEVVEIT